MRVREFEEIARWGTYLSILKRLVATFRSLISRLMRIGAINPTFEHKKIVCLCSNLGICFDGGTIHHCSVRGLFKQVVVPTFYAVLVDPSRNEHPPAANGSSVFSS